MSVGPRLLSILEDLGDRELDTFAYYLSCLPEDARRIPRSRLENISAVKLADLIMRFYPERELGVTAQILEKMHRRDLLKALRCDTQAADPHPGGANGGGQIPSREAPERPVPSELISQAQMMTLAKNMGKTWKQIGIQFLGMKKEKLEQIELENHNDVPMQIFHMLCAWKNRERGQATAAELYRILNQEGVPLEYEAYGFLMGND